MFVLLGSLLRLLVAPPNLRDIALENLALRQQLAVKGHPYGLDLASQDKKALIAFLKTL